MGVLSALSAVVMGICPIMPLSYTANPPFAVTLLEL